MQCNISNLYNALYSILHLKCTISALTFTPTALSTIFTGLPFLYTLFFCYELMNVAHEKVFLICQALLGTEVTNVDYRTSSLAFAELLSDKILKNSYDFSNCTHNKCLNLNNSLFFLLLVPVKLISKNVLLNFKIN